jgi:hypothetical protein
MKTLTEGVKKTLVGSAATLQSQYDMFCARHAAYARECEKEKLAPLSMNALKPVRVEGDNHTPQSLQRVSYVNAPPALISTDEASTLFEVADKEMAAALADLIICFVDGVTKKSVRIGEAKAAGTTVAKSSSAAVETEADGTSRVSIVGLTQIETWKTRILGRGVLSYYEGRGAMARLLLVPAATEMTASERMRCTTAPGSGPDSPFKLWETTACKLAAGIEMHIERTSLYGKQVREESLPTFVFPWQREAKALGVVAASEPPHVPRGIMLGGDTMRRIKLRISAEARAALRERCAVLMEQAERGMLGPRNGALDALIRRLPDKVMQVAAAVHGLNEATYFTEVSWAIHNPDDPKLFIPAPTLELGFRFIEHATLSALTRGFYGHRVLGKETNAEKREREFYSPTVESEQSAARHSTDAIVLGKLAKVGPLGATVRDLLTNFSRKQRLMMPDAEAVRTVLDGLITSGRVVVSGELYHAIADKTGGED